MGSGRLALQLENAKPNLGKTFAGPKEQGPDFSAHSIALSLEVKECRILWVVS